MSSTRTSETEARTRWSPSEAQAFLKEWRTSGKSLRAYCKRRGVLYERVRRWRCKLEDDQTASSVSFRPVDVVNLPGDSRQDREQIEVVLRSGHVLRLKPPFDLSSLRSLIALLDSACS